MPREKIAICLPCKMTPKGPFFRRLCKWLNHLNTQDVYDYELFVGHDPTVHVARIRERVLDRVMDSDCTYMLWLDDDVLFPLDILDQFFAAGKDCQTGIYWDRGNQKNTEHKRFPLLMKEDAKMMQYEFWKYEDDYLFSVVKAGFGCFFMKTDLVNYMPKPRFRLEASSGFGEDGYFCMVLGSAAEQHPECLLYANAKVTCEHIIYVNGEMVHFPSKKMMRQINEKYNP